jgi:hypothetical protein
MSTQRKSQSIRFSYGKNQTNNLEGKVYQIPLYNPSNIIRQN